jgi:tetraacyldisaccharide 4'-kinase
VIAPLARALWSGTGAGAQAARGALYPLQVAYGSAVALRSALYDRGLLSSYPLALPAVSVGNLTVGGTGKTPIAAWLVAELVSRGARPAVVLRGYGGDEALVHAMLNPGTPIVTGADRVAAAARARDLGADTVVLDDAFQHRRARRDADVVLLSADAWNRSRRLLPAGPWREPLSALRRASLVVVTSKAAGPDAVEEILGAAAAAAPDVPRTAVRLAPAGLVDGRDPSSTRALTSLGGARVLAVAGVADPEAFRRQLEALGARVDLRAYADHYPFGATDAVELARAAAGGELVVCTLKDAVKLAPLWPRGGPGLWYLSQQVILERGRPVVERLIDRLLQARIRSSPTAG